MADIAMQTIRRMIPALQLNNVADHKSQAAVLIGLCREQDPHVLLTQRAAHLRRHAGEIAFPGGKKDIEDDSLLVTALRESYEEIGLPANKVEIIGQLPTLVSRYGVQVTPFVGVIPEQVPLNINEDELQGAFYVPLSFLAEPANMYVDEVEYQGRRKRVPRFQYSDYAIWGITAVMLVELVNTVYGQRLFVNSGK